ncbi:MAG: sugar phosphate isomerase/epimerase [Litorilinea sp.]
MQTRTGGFPVGFRRGGGDWQQDLSALIAWTQANDLSVIDLGKDGDTAAAQVVAAGLQVGSVDLPEWQPMIGADRGRREEALARNRAYIERCSEAGVRNYFLVMLPEDASLPRAENFGYMVDSFGALAETLEAHNGRLVIEGWPGPGALCCTPEGYRAFFDQVASPSLGINYDPSHLIRMGIDYMRFLEEFAARIFHVHGKDTAHLDENLYEFGHEQPPTFAKPRPYAGMAWRYAIPGHGVTRWVDVLERLTAHGYNGAICVELEDANYHGSAEAEQQGIVLGAQHLAGC